ncbi:MAG: sphingosine kinase [Labilithrix sp.]|nr:sphingosine kinase [Labilithrix sp.]MCW5814287.1 sphingosine kinase [Labilithrix sp.]
MTEAPPAVTLAAVPGIGVIFNPKSGRNLRDPRAARRLAKTLGDQGVIREAGSIDELYRVAEDFRKLDIDVLGISGGDGTNGTTITGFLDVYAGNALPRIAFLRGGTMNTVANACGVPRGKPEGLLERLCRAYVRRAAEPLAGVERHVMCLEAERGTNRGSDRPPASMRAPALAKKYGFNFGTGVVPGYLAEYYAYGKGQPPNPLIAAKTLARGIASAAVGGEMIKRMAAPFDGWVELEDGTVWSERSYLAIAGGTIDQIGLNFRPFYRYAETPNTFHVLGIHTSPLGFVSQLPRIWRAQPMRPGHTFEAVTSHLVIRSRTPIRYMVDGDLHACDGALHVSIGPRVRIVLT